MTDQIRRSLLDPIPELVSAAEQLGLVADRLLIGDAAKASDLLAGIDQEPLRRYWNSKQDARNTALATNRRIGGPVPERRSTGESRSGRAWDELQVTIGRRDGWYCRYSEVPVVAKGARVALCQLLPSLDLWPEKGKGRDARRHQALVVLHASLDHVEAAWQGGLHDSNLVIACAVCQFSKMGHSLDSLGLANPLDAMPVAGDWDGLERVTHGAPQT